jgi:pSer/pThr/pTyr-binding forkhead associated (FHA) protein
MIRIVISDPDGTTTVVPFVRDEILIGRKEGNTIRLTERNISRSHCELRRSDDSYVVRDLGSYNGVIVNGQRIEGETTLQPGDSFCIGDYTVQLDRDEHPTLEEFEEAEPTLVAPLPRSTPPARLVVLTSALAGGEFTLPERGELRIGRAPELEIALDHRSVSREHAKIVCDGDEVRIIDQSSVNGVLVNGEKVTDARLVPGDMMELGDVAIRFVGPSELYVFDPSEARTLSVLKRGRQRRRQTIGAGAVIAVMVIVALVVAGREKPSASVAAPPLARTDSVARAALPPAAEAPPSAPQPVVQAPPALPSPPAVAPENKFEESLAACREAMAGGRFAEAIAHANAALKIQPDGQEAIDCQRLAMLNDEQEQLFVRGKAALAAGDVVAAWRELAKLSPSGTRRNEPDVVEVVEAAANKFLDRAEAQLHRRPADAEKLAQSVLDVQPLTAPLHDRAESIVDRYRAAAATPSKASPPPRRAAEPRPAANDKPVMEVASDCLARGDNACVIRALSGKAHTSQELGLLIETYLALGEAAQATRYMSTYVERFPTARRAETYRAMLQRQGH